MLGLQPHASPSPTPLTWAPPTCPPWAPLDPTFPHLGPSPLSPPWPLPSATTWFFATPISSFFSAIVFLSHSKLTVQSLFRRRVMWMSPFRERALKGGGVYESVVGPLSCRGERGIILTYSVSVQLSSLDLDFPSPRSCESHRRPSLSLLWLPLAATTYLLLLLQWVGGPSRCQNAKTGFLRDRLAT
jgi:hypothetical protein